MSHVERGIEYARQVVSGEIPAGKYVRLACQRQLTDLDNSISGKFPYWFDRDAAEDVCEFIENLTHIKGDKAREPILLEPWQSFCLTTQFGWKRANGKRRFRTVFMLEPRGNGKSTIEAGVALYALTMSGEEGAEIYCGATNEKQALFVFKPAWMMVQRDSELREAFGLSLTGTFEHPTGIHLADTASSFTPLIGKPGDGGNPYLAIVDEFHEHDDDTMVSAMKLGAAKRQESMLRIISTAGDNLSGPCYQMQLDMQQILEGQAQADDVFAIIYAADPEDEWDSIETAKKANPNYGVSISEEAILADLEEAKRNPSKQSAYKTKHLNIWVGSNSPFFNLEAWLALGNPELNEDEFCEENCWMGTDAASKMDLSSTVKIFRRIEDGKKHIYMFGRHYLPEGRVNNPDNPNKQYRAWADDGKLIATDGNATDLQLVEQHILDDSERYVVRRWGFDRMYLNQMSQRLEERGLTVVEIPQTKMHLSAAMKEWQALIEDGRIHHNGDPILSWAVANTVSKPDTNDNVKPLKNKDEMKIDPVVAGVMALAMEMGDEDADDGTFYETESIYL